MSSSLRVAALAALCLWAVPAAAGDWPLRSDVKAPRQVLAQLRDQVRPDYALHVTRHFAILHPASARFAGDAGALLEHTYRTVHRDFTRLGMTPAPLGTQLVCVVFDDRGRFETYARAADGVDMSWCDGYYSARTNRIALLRPGVEDVDDEHDEPELAQAAAGVGAGEAVGADTAPSPRTSPDIEPEPGDAHNAALAVDDEPARGLAGHSLVMAKLTHEAAHQLAFNSGLQRRGVMYPLWVSEGLATNFEIDADGRMGLEHDNTFRRRRLEALRLRKALVELDEFVTISIVPDDVRIANDLYAQAWGFFRFIAKHDPKGLKQYLDAIAHTSTGWRSARALRHEFVAAFGEIAPLQRAWNEYIANPSPASVDADD